MRTVSLFGAALFVAAVVVQTFAVGSLLWRTSLTESESAASPLLLVSMVLASALLTPLIAFTIGDKATKARSRYEHFYNGVLFALLAIWLGILVGQFIVPLFVSGLSYVASMAWSAVIVIAMVLGLGVAYGKKRHQKLLHEYEPYQIALVLTLFALVATSLLQLVTSLLNPYPTEYGFAIVIPALMQVVMIVVPYRLSREKTVLGRLTESAIAASIGFTAVMIVGQIPMYGLGAATNIIVPSAVGVIVWLAYLYQYYYRVRDRLG